MKKTLFVLLAIAAGIGLTASGCRRRSAEAPDYRIQAVPLTQVDITDRFWAPKQEVNRKVSLPYVFRKSEETERLGAAQLVEAAAYMIQKRPDPELESFIDAKIDRMLEAMAARASDPRRTVRVGGTFLEAAAAWYEATGKRKMIDAALQAADRMDETFGPGKQAYISGHEGLKIGLIRLSRQTGDERYWQLARFFLDIRGRDEFKSQSTSEYPGDETYHQNHVPVLEQEEAVGHCVRATYLYIPLTDVAALTGEPAYAAASERIWNDVVSRKMYITGGIGSVRQQERFGDAYELPNLSAWNETCAAYGKVVWNHRLFLLSGDGKYADTMEQVLYNGFLVGVSQAGDRFFYQNPLVSYGDYERFAWINVPCCPPNVVRLIAQLGSYIYARSSSGKDLYVNLFVGSEARTEAGGGPVVIRQETRYPWDGRIRISIDPERPGRFALAVRIPGWTRGQVTPSDLYEPVDLAAEAPALLVNGEPFAYQLQNGYARIDRRWKAGDSVEIDLPMPVVLIRAHPKVRDSEGRLAITRGPLVYCAEWPDNAGSALNIILPENPALRAEFSDDVLGGVTVVRGSVGKAVRGADGKSMNIVPHDLTAVPYYAWANRGPGEMAVWLAASEDKAWLEPVLPSPIAKVRSSGGIPKAWTGYNDQNDSLSAVFDGYEPLSSADESYRYFRMRAPQGRPAWVEYEFEKPMEISSADAYFVDDRRFCRLPLSWRILVKDGDRWILVKAEGGYPVEKDQFSRATFAPVTARAVRIEVEPQAILYKSGAAGPPAAVTIHEDVVWRECGLIEWRVK